MAKAKKATTKAKAKGTKKLKKVSAAKIKKIKGGRGWGTSVPSGFSRADANPKFGARTPNTVPMSGGGGGNGSNRARAGRGSSN